MTQFAPHIAALAGAVLLVNATMTKADGWLNGFLFRLIPSAVGAASLWMSAALFMAGAA